MSFFWELSDFDTKHFGFKTAKILSINFSGNSNELDERIEKLLLDFKKNGIEYATYRLPANDFPLIHALERVRFILVDGLINLELEVDKVNEFEKVESVRKATLDDIDSLKKIANNSFSLTRFYNDPAISKDKANHLYAKWIENSLTGMMADLVLLWEEKGKILGFITLRKKGHIPLLGVTKATRGKGMAKKLIRATFPKFKQWGAKVVAIETQMGNIPALRAYQSCGFKPVNSHLTFSWRSK